MELSNYSIYFARFLIAAYFVVAGFLYARDWQVHVEELRSLKILLPTISLWMLVLIYIVGGIALFFGIALKLTACLFIVVIMLANALHRRFWCLNGIARRQQLQAFMLNLALIGALILIVSVSH